MKPALLILAGCAGHYTPPPMPVCRESATLPDAATTYECPVGAQVAVHEAEAGPVVLCLCPAMDDVEIDEAVVRLEVGP